MAPQLAATHSFRTSLWQKRHYRFEVLTGQKNTIDGLLWFDGAAYGGFDEQEISESLYEKYDGGESLFTENSVCGRILYMEKEQKLIQKEYCSWWSIEFSDGIRIPCAICISWGWGRFERRCNHRWYRERTDFIRLSPKHIISYSSRYNHTLGQTQHYNQGCGVQGWTKTLRAAYLQVSHRSNITCLVEEFKNQIDNNTFKICLIEIKQN